jgi:hypothetical protein
VVFRCVDAVSVFIAVTRIRALGIYSPQRQFSRSFYETAQLRLIVRSHQLMMRGCQLMFRGKLITVFSASNYCQHVGNQGAVLQFRYQVGLIALASVNHYVHLF